MSVIYDKKNCNHHDSYILLSFACIRVCTVFLIKLRKSKLNFMSFKLFLYKLLYKSNFYPKDKDVVVEILLMKNLVFWGVIIRI